MFFLLKLHRHKKKTFSNQAFLHDYETKRAIVIFSQRKDEGREPCVICFYVIDHKFFALFLRNSTNRKKIIKIIQYISSQRFIGQQ